MHRQPAKRQCCNRLANDSSDTPQGSTLWTGPCCDAGYSPPVVPCRALSHNGRYFQDSNKPAMSLPRQSHMLGPVAYAERGRCALPLHMRSASPRKRARGNRPAPHRLQRGQPRRIFGSAAPGGLCDEPVQRRGRPGLSVPDGAPMCSFPVLPLVRPDSAIVAPGSCLLSLR